MRIAALGVALSLVAVSSAADPIPDVRFVGLGDLPGGAFESLPFDLSADGGTAVGRSTGGAGVEAFRWTLAGGMEGLGDLAGGPTESWALGISDDGEVVVGFSDSATGREAFRWTLAGGMVGIGYPAGSLPVSSAADASADGSVLVGNSDTPAGTEAFRWTAAGGFTSLGDLPGGSFGSLVADVTADGSLASGHSNSTDAPSGQIYRWTEADGIVGVADFDLPGGAMHSRAGDMTPDGSAIVGSSTSAAGYEAIRWTEADGIVSLGRLGDLDSFAEGVSADGAFVVGTGGQDTDPGQAPFVWNELDGLRNLQTVLESDLGLDLTGWTLRHALAISADGRTIVGNGESPGGASEAWLAVLYQAQSKPQQKCILGLGKRGASVLRVQDKEGLRCLKSAALGKVEQLGPGGTAQGCLEGDVRGKAAAAGAKTLLADAGLCLALPEQRPGFGRSDGATVNASAVEEARALMGDLFGADLDAAVVSAAADPIGSRCQQEVAKRGQALFEHVLQLGLGASRGALKGGAAPAVDSPTDLKLAMLAAVDEDAKGSYAAKALQLRAKSSLRCSGALASAGAMFPGTGAADLAAALDGAERSARCRACRALERFAWVPTDCDAFDDGVADGSCG